MRFILLFPLFNKGIKFLERLAILHRFWQSLKNELDHTVEVLVYRVEEISDLVYLHAARSENLWRRCKVVNSCNG